MSNSVSLQGSTSLTIANRADVNSLRGAAGRNAGGNSDAVSTRSLVSAKTTSSQSRIEAFIKTLQMYNVLSPSDQALIQMKLADQIKADAHLTFRYEDIKFVSLDAYHDFPRTVIDLAKSKTHVPLTLLTYPAIKKLHAGEDISTFPPEDTISEINFHQASHKFIGLMSLVASPAIVERFKAHRSFCLSHMLRFRTVVAFDIETRRVFFNTESFLEEDAYISRWKALDMDIVHKELSERIHEAAAVTVKSDHRFHPYSKSHSGNVRSLCLICGRTDHKASDCTDPYTVKEEAVVCEWDGTLVLKSTAEVVCIAFNIGRCGLDHARVHVCSICGSHGHDTKGCC
ncbi:hypothetical protein EV702DRAFT_1202191 [Suillus placidus]|uniref:CCHC-type domain-containing protein n=1 Tax=Suillus placidus TaxID=48579 RepID=A0A9P6ZM13_9AGAM|nr:hypothetical protein EV702DRAFT_1202191 [Suillus placidus]